MIEVALKLARFMTSLRGADGSKAMQQVRLRARRACILESSNDVRQPCNGCLIARLQEADSG
jgi:hypothetical protein